MILKSNKELKQKDFKNEKELQTYIENNMKTILGFQFIETEFSVGNFRIDSLGYDRESNAFRIVEYKNIKNGSLVDQGYTYLKILLERKADFVLKYNEKTNSTLRINDIDFSQDITLLTICNGKYYGGGFKIAPNAVFNDGMFDIYLADKVSKTQIPGLILKVVKGTHEDSKYVHKLSSNKVIIHSDKALNCNLDGEIFSLNDMEFEVTDKKIPIYTANDKIKKLCKSKGLYK